MPYRFSLTVCTRETHAHTHMPIAHTRTRHVGTNTHKHMHIHIYFTSQHTHIHAFPVYDEHSTLTYLLICLFGFDRRIF